METFIAILDLYVVNIIDVGVGRDYVYVAIFPVVTRGRQYFILFLLSFQRKISLKVT